MKGEILGVLLSLAAGLATCVGASVVFCTNRLNARMFSGCLAFSAGVMLYVSFVEIFQESINQIKHGMEDSRKGVPYLIGTISFFGGWIFCSMFDRVLGAVLDWRNRRKSNEIPPRAKDELWHLLKDSFHESLNSANPEIGEVDTCSVRTADSYRPFEMAATNIIHTPDEDAQPHQSPCWTQPVACVRRLRLFMKREPLDDASAIIERIAHYQFTKDSKIHVRLGIFTAMVLGLHNLPEGVATWSAAMINPTLGFGLASAIAIHNIPEGIAVAVPIYYSTGSRTKGFLYAFISGMAEPVGALLCWAIVGDSTQSLYLGVIFGVVCGIMTNVALKELYPKALKYDPADRVSSRSLFAGLCVMALSLVAFEF